MQDNIYGNVRLGFRVAAARRNLGSAVIKAILLSDT